MFTSSESNKCTRQIELLIICLYSEWSEDRIMVVQHFWWRKIYQIVWRVPRKWLASKLLNQDVDVVFLANKGIVIWCFVGRNYSEILMEIGKLRTTSGSRKKDSDLVLTECLSCRILRFTTSPIDLIHLERVTSLTSPFLVLCLAYASHASMKISKF